MNPKDLVPERIQLHYAIQFIAATGMALGKGQPDGSQIALDWDSDLQSFVGSKIPGTQIQIALIPATLTSLILQSHPVATLSLVGKTLAEALDWHQAELAHLGVTTESIKPLDYPPDDFPDHALAGGAVFATGSTAGRDAVAAYYAITRPLLADIVAANSTAAPIYIWPHHFDMATLITYSGATAAETKYLGVGLSPGDGGYDEPYWYITPYPYPKLSALPELPVGEWHTEGWVGAILTASQVQDDTTIQRFINAGVAASKNLLGVL